MSIPLPSTEERELRRTIRDTEDIQEALFQSIMGRVEDAPNAFDCVTMLRLALDVSDACGSVIVESILKRKTHRKRIARLRALSKIMTDARQQIREAEETYFAGAVAGVLIKALRNGHLIDALERLVLESPDLQTIPVWIPFSN